MFYGSVPAEAQAIMNKIVKAWDVSDIYVGCSGNFTLEKFIGPLGRFRLHSNDVTMYSLCLGAHFMREHVPLELSEEGEAMFPWLPEYMKTDVDRLATMLLCSRIVAFTDKGDNLQRFEVEAQKLLAETGADHVLYGRKLYDEGGELEELRFYLMPMTDEWAENARNA